MAKLQQGISNGASADEVAKGITAARLKSSRKNGERPISRGPGLSSSDSINITMNALNQLQEHFGKIHFVPATAPDEPALLVLPLPLVACEKCGTIIERKNGPFCRWHGPENSKDVIPELETQVA
jgi:hypothetical protein